MIRIWRAKLPQSLMSSTLKCKAKRWELIQVLLILAEFLKLDKSMKSPILTSNRTSLMVVDMFRLLLTHGKREYILRTWQMVCSSNQKLMMVHWMLMITYSWETLHTSTLKINNTHKVIQLFNLKSMLKMFSQTLPNTIQQAQQVHSILHLPITCK